MQKIGDAGKQKHPSMAYTLSNKCNKNCCKRSIIVQLSVYFVPFLSYLTLKNIVTMKCRLWVNHNANLCNMHDLYMVEICSHGAIFSADNMGLSSFTSTQQSPEESFVG